jgi:prolyl-tRNA synthetase
MAKTAINPTREQNYATWYQEVIKAADLAEHSPVRGCMVIKPYGYAIWENMQKILDTTFKEEDVQNAYFPLFIPLSFLEKEAAHVEGFAKEVAVVTHSRLEKNEDGKLVPASKLEEPLIVRPTSEMIIGHMFSKWVQSYRDLPLKINQWANVVRWEMRTRLFLRTTEFLWQEGHTVHATKEEALAETKKMLDVYASFFEDILAIPVVKGVKTESEKFPGAVSTFCVEAMMQDKKALQGGTTHYLGQNFSKSCNIKFRNEKEEEVLAYTTSWGVATRMIGALIMTHSDDDGLILPPKIAPYQVVILPVVHKPELKAEILKYANKLKDHLRKKEFNNEKLKVHIDTRDVRGGEKKWSWIKKGAPIIIEIGPKEVENEKIFYIRRDEHFKKQDVLSFDMFENEVVDILEKMQQNIFIKARKFREDNTKIINDQKEFYKFFSKDKNIGFAYAHFSLDPSIEEKLQKDLNVTVRCIPSDGKKEEGTCIFSGKPSTQRVLFAKSY